MRSIDVHKWIGDARNMTSLKSLLSPYVTSKNTSFSESMHTTTIRTLLHRAPTTSTTNRCAKFSSRYHTPIIFPILDVVELLPCFDVAGCLTPQQLGRVSTGSCRVTDRGPIVSGRTWSGTRAHFIVHALYIIYISLSCWVNNCTLTSNVSLSILLWFNTVTNVERSYIYSYTIHYLDLFK